MSTSLAKRSVLILGPGYSGREILDLLKLREEYAVVTVVRRQSAADELSKDGVRTVIGDLDSTELIRELARESDVIFNTASADHHASVEAVLAGIKDRATNGKQTVYLHQSGSAFLSDGSSEEVNETIFCDLNPDQIDALPDNAPHRDVDLTILKARKELGTKAKIFIVFPPIIYGVNKAYNRLTIQVPALTRFAFKHGYAGHVGKGKGRWATVHVLDLAKAYETLLGWVEQSGPEIALEHPYFFCESDEVSWFEVAEAIGKNLLKAGKLADATPRQIPETDFGDVFGHLTVHAVGSNARNRAERLRTLGWQPVQKDFFTAFETEELPILLKEVPESFKPRKLEATLK